MASKLNRACWINCFAPDDERFFDDHDIVLIDQMGDALSPLDENVKQLRQIITRFEACYHEADREAEYITESIGAGHCLEQSQQRPAGRQAELTHARDILTLWCDDPQAALENVSSPGGEFSAAHLCYALEQPTPLKIWQVQRVVDKVSQALDERHPYHFMALNVGEYGEETHESLDGPYQSDLGFLKETRETLIYDSVDGQASKVSLAYAIDLLQPCCWDFVGSLVTLLGAIGGDCHPQRPLACCARNIKRSPLCDRLNVISDTLHFFWKDDKTLEARDDRILASLGTSTPGKRWLAASLDKTIRLHLTLPWEMDLF